MLFETVSAYGSPFPELSNQLIHFHQTVRRGCYWRPSDTILFPVQQHGGCANFLRWSNSSII